MRLWVHKEDTAAGLEQLLWLGSYQWKEIDDQIAAERTQSRQRTVKSINAGFSCTRTLAKHIVCLCVCMSKIIVCRISEYKYKKGVNAALSLPHPLRLVFVRDGCLYLYLHFPFGNIHLKCWLLSLHNLSLYLALCIFLSPSVSSNGLSLPWGKDSQGWCFCGWV